MSKHTRKIIFVKDQLNISDETGQIKKTEMDLLKCFPKILVDECIPKIKEENNGYVTSDQLTRLLSTQPEVSLQLQEHNNDTCEPPGYFTNSPTDSQTNNIISTISSSSNSYSNISDVPLFNNLDLHNNGFVSLKLLILYWESLGIVNTTQVLLDLGISKDQSPVDIRRLSYLLNEEISQYKDIVSYPSVKAGIITLQNEVRVVKLALDSVTREKDKICADLKVAKEQTSLLLTEIDEQYICQEKERLKELQVIEKYWKNLLEDLQRKSEEGQDLAMLEILDLKRNMIEKAEFMKIIESNLKQDICQLKEEHFSLESENQTLKTKCLEAQELLENIISEDEQIQTNYSKEQQKNLSQIGLNSIYLGNNFKELEEQNKLLQDRNDELEVKVYKLKEQEFKYPLQSLNKFHQATTSGDTNACSKAFSISCSDNFISKIKICNDSNVDTDMLSTEDNKYLIKEMEKSDKDVTDFEFKLDGVKCEIVKILSQKDNFLKENETLRSLQYKYKELEKQNEDLKKKLENFDMFSLKEMEVEKVPDLLQINKEYIQASIGDAGRSSPDGEANYGTQSILKEFEQSFKSKSDQEVSKTQDELVKNNKHLEESLEMMQLEFESLEDYWQKKIEEERGYYEKQLKSNEEQFSELASRMKEYEELLLAAESSTNSKEINLSDSLSVIDEEREEEEKINVWEDEISALKSVFKEMEDKHLVEIKNLQDIIRTMSQPKKYSKLTTYTNKEAIRRAFFENKPGDCSPTFNNHGQSSSNHLGFEQRFIENKCNKNKFEHIFKSTGDSEKSKTIRTKSHSDIPSITAYKIILSDINREMDELTSQLKISSKDQTNIQLKTSSKDPTNIQLKTSSKEKTNIQQRLEHQANRCNQVQSALAIQKADVERTIAVFRDEHLVEVNQLEGLVSSSQQLVNKQTRKFINKMENLVLNDHSIEELMSNNRKLKQKLNKVMKSLI